jgi:hypothetical protein
MSNQYIPLNLASLLKITQETARHASVSLGWVTLVHIEEEDGFWTVRLKGESVPISMRGSPSVEAAVEALVKYLTPE